MTDISNLIRGIKSCVNDDTLYLLEKISDTSGLFVLNGNILYLILNTDNRSNMSIRTDYLHLETNIHVSAFSENAQSFEDGYYNSIELYIQNPDNCEENLKAFVNLCCSYASNEEIIDFATFFDSLVTLFQLPKEQTYKNLIGVIGELSIIDYFFDSYKVDLSRYWHTNGITSKLDFVTPHVNIEVKTTPSNDLIFQIKHDQLFYNSNATYLATVSISENNSGFTFNELANKQLSSPLYCNSFEFATNLEAERRRVNPQEASQKRFIIKNIKLFNALEICPFQTVPENVTELSYKINLVSSKNEDTELVANNCE